MPAEMEAVGEVLAAAGVYAITHLPSGKVYVGSARNVRGRLTQHASELRRGVHHNPRMQEAWQEDGGTAFCCRALEMCAVAALRDVEQRWIDHYAAADPERGFNVHPRAKSSVGRKMPPEVRIASSRRQSRAWTGFVRPDGGAEPVIENMREFCEAHGLTRSAMTRMAAGDPMIQSHKGWTHEASPPRRPAPRPRGQLPHDRCPRGHDLTQRENRTANGKACRPCRKANQRAWYARKKEAIANVA